MSESAGTGRGLAFITAAKLYFILSGFIVQLGLPRLLGSPEAFGQYSLAMSIVSVVNNVLIAATVQSVSKRISEDESLRRRALRQALLLQLGVGVTLAGELVLRPRPGWRAWPTTPSSSAAARSRPSSRSVMRCTPPWSAASTGADSFRSRRRST